MLITTNSKKDVFFTRAGTHKPKKGEVYFLIEIPHRDIVKRYGVEQASASP